MANDKPQVIPVPLHTRDERRASDRFVATMPVSVDGREAVTDDLSPTGLSFISELAYERGARIKVVIEYLLDGHQYPLHCEAEVMRVDKVPGGYRVGARLAPQSGIEEVAVPAIDDAAAAARQRLRRIE